MSKHPGPFQPPFFLKNPHLQTLGSYFLSSKEDLRSQTHWVTLNDGDQMSLEISYPQEGAQATKMILMMPGTAGSYQSRYLIRLAKRFIKQGYLTARLNFRGIATALGRAKKISHAGCSEDILTALSELKKMFPHLEFTLIGFSLSAATLLKLAGEFPLEHTLKRILAVCPPLELSKSSQLLEQKQNRIYQTSIVQTILKIISHPKSQFEYRPKSHLKGIRTLREFDEAFTAPSWGFKNALDYYQQCSCLNHIPQIRVQTHILFAKDDPLIDYRSIFKVKCPSNLEVLSTNHGGHMGFLNGTLKDPFWMDQMLLHWLNT